MKKCILTILFTLIFAITGCSSNPNVLTSLDQRTNTVREGSMEAYPDIKIGDAYAAFFSNPQWKYFENKEGVKVVEFSGGCVFREVQVTAKQQFILGKDGKFEVGALSFNDVPQVELISVGLMEKVFLSYKEVRLIDDIKKNLYGQWQNSLTGKKITLTEKNIRVLTDSSTPPPNTPQQAFFSLEDIKNGIGTFWVGFKEEDGTERAFRAYISQAEAGSLIMMMDVLRQNGSLLRSEEYVKIK